MNEHKFEEMFYDIIDELYCDKPEVCQRMVRFGGRKKLCKMLFDDEKILAISFGHNVEDSVAVTVFLSNDALVITNKRFIFLQSRMLGTLVKEIPLSSVKSIDWSGKGNTLHISGTVSTLNIYINDDGIEIIKRLIYDIFKGN